MKFLISGASSDFSRAIGDQLSSAGHFVTMVGRTTKPEFDLEDPNSSLPKLFTSHDVFLHFAHSFEKQEDPDLNLNAAIQIVNLLEKSESKVRKCIYISSDSANLRAKSMYGRSKFRTENVFLKSRKSAVLRVGIIIDENVSSPYQKVKRLAKLTRILIFPSPNKEIFTSVTIECIVRSILDISEKNVSGGPYGPKERTNRKSLVSILKDDGVNLMLIIGVPSGIVRLTCLLGTAIPTLNRVADSLLSIQVEPEEIQRLK